MCGLITAISSASIDQARFNAARDLMLHRGPDAQRSVFLANGHVALGHTRLSILDLSSRSHQPMQSDNLWVTYNGEIYNYPQLKKELESQGYVFNTTSDTEVLLHGYRAWGSALAEKLIGMFAFAIWDDTTQKMLLGRDHVGQKPLYYAQIDGQFVAGSEIKALRAYLNRTLTMRRASIVDALVQDFVAEPETWYEEISALPAGCQMEVDASRVGQVKMSISNYWQFDPTASSTISNQADALDALEEQVFEAISSHMLADVEVGAFLSGGVDSTCVATIASQLNDDPLRTFTIGFGGDDEASVARDTATRIGSRHTEANITENDFRNFGEHALNLFDYPFADTSIVATERVASIAAKDVKVVLTGDGGDESFGGYNYGRFIAPDQTPKPALAPSLKAVRDTLFAYWDSVVWHAKGPAAWQQQARERLFSMRTPSARRTSMLAPDLLRSLADYDPSAAYRRHNIDGLCGFRNAQWVGIKVPLPSRMLVKVDRCAMAHSLETRAPFLSPRLIEFLLTLPRTVSNPENNWFKGLFRIWLKDKISNDVLHGKKRGFDVPKTWGMGDLRHAQDKELLPRCVDANLVRPKAWQTLNKTPRMLWYFLQIESALEKGVLDC